MRKLILHWTRDCRTTLVVAAIAVGLVACGGTTSSEPAINDQLSASEDNGAMGRNPFNNRAHVAPVDACKDKLIATDQSLIIRVLPRGPLAPDGSLAFTSGVCVYLPPGYLKSNRRYPVLYLLHGGGGDAADWVTFGGIRSIIDDAVAANPTDAVIVVMPDGTDAQWSRWQNSERTVRPPLSDSVHRPPLPNDCRTRRPRR